MVEVGDSAPSPVHSEPSVEILEFLLISGLLDVVIAMVEGSPLIVIAIVIPLLLIWVVVASTASQVMDYLGLVVHVTGVAIVDLSYHHWSAF